MSQLSLTIVDRELVPATSFDGLDELNVGVDVIQHEVSTLVQQDGRLAVDVELAWLELKLRCECLIVYFQYWMWAFVRQEAQRNICKWLVSVVIDDCSVIELIMAEIPREVSS